MFLSRCKGTENKWYMQEFYTFMNDFFENSTLLWRTFVVFTTLLWRTFWVITKYEGKFWRQLLTIKIDNYWQFVNIFCCGLVYLAPARCAHEILLNLITHKSALTKVLRNQLPPLHILGTSKTWPLNLNCNDSDLTLIDLWNAYRCIHKIKRMLAVAMDFGEHRKEGLGVGIRLIKISAQRARRY